ncbi:MAG: ATP-binding protein, partial [Candidatus Bathyarchaeota archaeon]|nr:ATP-binding protein [Candidatus Bathyarchaeota archaeon]
MHRKMEDGFHLGKRLDPEQLRLPSEEMVLGSPFYISARDLLTHAIILGMTGCGKTVLAKIMIEEA